VFAPRGLRESCHPVDMIKSPSDMIQVTRLRQIDDVRSESMVNFRLTWHKLSFLIGHFEFEFEVIILLYKLNDLFIHQSIKVISIAENCCENCRIS
jgi:hypothetical protein